MDDTRNETPCLVCTIKYTKLSKSIIIIEDFFSYLTTHHALKSLISSQLFCEWEALVIK